MSRKKSKKGKRKADPAIKNEIIQAPVSALEIKANFWERNVIPGLIILMLPILLYGGSLGHGYVLDDQMVLSDNNFVKDGVSGIWDILSNDTFTGYFGEQKNLIEGGRYRPLSLVTFAVEYEIFGDQAGRFHLLNILWYTLLGLLIFRILGILFPSDNKAWYFTIPFVATLLFIAHPIHTEAVANIKGRDEILTLFLSLSALYYSLRYISKPKPIYLLLSGIIFLLALLSKENAITFLGVIPLTLFAFTHATFKQHAKSFTTLVLATVLYLFIRYEVMGYLLDMGKTVSSLMNNPFVEMTGGEKYATIFYTLWRYVELLIFPHPLTHDYYPYHIPKIGWDDIRAIGPLLFYLFIGLFSFAKILKNKNVIAYSILFYLFTISITSNLVFGVGTFMNERFAFMPSLGFTILIAFLFIEYLPKKFPKVKAVKVLGVGLVSLILMGYSYKTIDRVPDWKSPSDLNASAIKVSINSARINNFMGYDYYNRSNEATDPNLIHEYLDQATVYADKALEIHPQYSDALKLKAGLYGGYYKLDRDLPKLLEGFYELLKVKQIPFIDTYLEYLNNRGGNEELINFYHKTGFEYFTLIKRNYALADKYFQYGIGLEPNNTLLLQDLCIMNYKRGKMAESIQYGNKALALDPSLAEVKKYVNLANTSN